MNISLPEEMRTWVEAQVEQGGFGTVSEFFRQILRDEQKRRARAQIESKLLAALESGDPVEVTPEFWARLRSEARSRANTKQAK